MIPVWAFTALVVGAIALTVGGTAALLILLVRDWTGGRLW